MSMEGSKFSRASVPEARPVSKTAPPGPSKLVTVTSAGDAKAPAETVIDGCLYKVTSNSSMVVWRRVKLTEHKFYTYHVGDADEHTKKTWYLDRGCQLNPKQADGIIKPATKTVRPRRTSTISATVRGKGESVNLYMFSLTWPRFWATKGYTTFTFGFLSQSEAQQWHGLFNSCIEKLKRNADKSKQTSGAQGASNSHLYRQSGTGSSHHGGTGRDSFDGKPGQTPNKAEQDDDSSGDDPGSPTKYHDVDSDGKARSPSLAQRTQHHLTAASSVGSGMVPVPGMGEDLGVPARSDDSDDSDADEDQEDDKSAGMAGAESYNAKGGLMERWVPHKQVNGLSVYYHAADPGEDGIVGGEYMVSTVVHGSPGRVLEVLMHGSANTTILGPARRMDVLEFTKVDDNTTTELVRLIIEAPGWAGYFCAPREMIVERMCKTDEKRAYVVMFRSSDDVALRSKAYTSKCDEGGSQVTGQARTRRLWSRPVMGSVSGVYTISCLNKHTLADSQESLITCMVKVDLGGACAAESWTGGLCDLFGFREAFLDRILMNVMLVRDEVEHRRFKMVPQQLVSTHATQTAQSEQLKLDDGLGSLILTQATARAPVSMLRSRTMARGAPHGLRSVTVPSSNGAAGAEGAGSPRAIPASREAFLRGAMMEAHQEEEEMAEHEARFAADHAGQEEGFAVLDYDYMASLSTLDRASWSPIHTEGTDAPFSVRGPTYLKDKKKIPAGMVQFAFAGMDMIEISEVTPHVARFLPSVRSSGMPFGIIINLVIPGTPLLGIVATFATEQHPAKVLCNPPADPMEEGHNWQPFDFVMHKFYFGSDETRNKMLKLIPHIADGSWMIKSSVGTTPVILGKALKTTYHMTPQYLEIDIDISANNIAAYVTGMVRGATKSLVIDMGFVLEGTVPWELPENLLGAIRLNYLDTKKAVPIDVTKELPLVPPRYIHDDTPPSPSAHDAGIASGSLTPPPGTLEPAIAGAARSTSMPSAQALAALGAGLQTPQGPGSVGGTSTHSGGTFGMRHRGHARTRSQVEMPNMSS